MNDFPPSAYFLAGHAGERKRERKTERKFSRLVKGAAPSVFPEHLRLVVPKRKAPVERQPLQPKTLAGLLLLVRTPMVTVLTNHAPNTVIAFRRLLTKPPN